jgi:hypothetical protein
LGEQSVQSGQEALLGWQDGSARKVMTIGAGRWYHSHHETALPEVLGLFPGKRPI